MFCCNCVPGVLPQLPSAPAGLTTGRLAASRTGHIARRNPALTGRWSLHARVTRKGQILNHAFTKLQATLDIDLIDASMSTIRVGHDYQDSDFIMRDLVTLYLTVRYRVPSKERSFLGKGWGIRDVRGPYLDGFVGHICIAGAVLSSETPSTISLVLSASNRCPTPFILAKVSTAGKEVSKNINKNGSTDFILESIYANSVDNLDLLVQLPDVQTAADLQRFYTILAIDELTIERLR